MENLDDELVLNLLYTALVVDNQDPEEEDRIKVRIPTINSTDEGIWARVATLDAGGNRGTFFMPDIEDEVIVGFEAGDSSRPVILGSLWNDQQRPPESFHSDNNRKSIVSRTGIRLTLDDTEGDPKLVFSTPGGQSLVFSDGESAITAADANGNTIRMDANGITITSPTRITMQASQIEASTGSLTLNAGVSRFSGIVQCDTLIANSVVKPP
jgi:uncharacterized protein involved in type VI secretion and phage assembly